MSLEDNGGLEKLAEEELARLEEKIAINHNVISTASDRNIVFIIGISTMLPPNTIKFK